MKIVGIGEYFISNNREEIIKTYSLGSCVAITMHCPNKKVSGMAHIALPSPTNMQESVIHPAYFAETAIPLMINKFCYTYGCRTNDLKVGIFGGALAMRDNDTFKIGLRNVQTITRIMAEKDIAISMNDTGGYFSRTVELDVGTGKIKIDTQPMII
ncbi:MAG TPA: chemotaxis protein CheD [Ruminiclostridium sp.]